MNGDDISGIDLLRGLKAARKHLVDSFNAAGKDAFTVDGDWKESVAVAIDRYQKIRTYAKNRFGGIVWVWYCHQYGLSPSHDGQDFISK